MSWDATQIDLVVQAAQGTNFGTLLSTTGISGAFSITPGLGLYICDFILATPPATWGRRPGAPSWYFGLGFVYALLGDYLVDYAELVMVHQLWWPKSAQINTIAGFLTHGISGSMNLYSAVQP